MTIETLHPGIYVREQARVPNITGISTSTGGFVGVTERGRTDRPVLLGSFTDYEKEFGGPLINSYMYDSVKGFFDNGGVRCYIGRVVGAGALKSTTTMLQVSDLTNDSLTVEALGEGSYGDGLSVAALKVSTTLASAMTAGSVNSCHVTSTRSIELGDVLYLTDGTTTLRAVVHGINFTTNVITFAAPTTLALDLAIGSSVYTASQHRFRTTLAADLATGATTAQLTSATLITIGQILTIADGTTITTVTVLGKNGNEISFSAVTLAATITAAGSIVATQEFMLNVYDGGVLEENHEYLSMSATNEADYVDNRLTGDSNQSSLVSVTDEVTVSVDAAFISPLSTQAESLSGGADGATPTDGDYIGSETVPSGMHLFDSLKDSNLLSIPGITTVAVQSDLVDYCEGRGDMMAVVEAPYAVDSAEEAREYMQITLNKASSYYALYYPWLVIRDPFDSSFSSTRRRNVPPSGFVQGQYADTDAQRGVHKAPANATLSNVLGVTTTVTDVDQDILNPIGVNCIRSFPGEGIKIFGARTGWTVTDGFHYVNVRRLMNYVKGSIKNGLRFVLFEPIQPVLYDNIGSIVYEFLTNLWRQGALYPTDDSTQAFWVKCNLDNNRDADRLGGRVNVELGIQPPYPAEFVVLTVSLYDGGTRFTELTA